MKKQINYQLYDYQRNCIFGIFNIEFNIKMKQYWTVQYYLNDEVLTKVEDEDGSILLEFTNFFDADGKKIYEDDILRSEDGQEYTVEWNFNQCCWWLSPKISFLSEDWPILHLNNQMLGNGYLKRRDMKIIGNKNIKKNGADETNQD